MKLTNWTTRSITLFIIVMACSCSNSTKMQHLESEIQVKRKNLKSIDHKLQLRSSMKGESVHYYRLMKEKERINRTLDSLIEEIH